MSKTDAVFKRIFYWLPALLYMALIFYMSSHPSPEAARRLPVYFDIKLVHIIEYGILTALYYFALTRSFFLKKSCLNAYSFMLTVLYGLTDEFHQLFVPSRSGKLEDIAADMIGAGIFLASIYLYLELKRSRRAGKA